MMEKSRKKLPAGWEMKTFGEVCSFERTAYRGFDLPYVGLEQIESNTGRLLGTVNPDEIKSNTYAFNSNHILYGRLRPYLNKVFVADFEGQCSTEILPILCNEKIIIRKYIFRWISSPTTVESINSTTTGARMPRANPNDILELEIPIPSLSEQQRIVAKLDDAFAEIEAAKANIERNLQNCKEVFQSELNAVFANNKGWQEKTLDQIAENLDSKRVPITKNVRSNGIYAYYGASGIVDYVGEYIFNEDLLLISEDGANLLARTYPIAFSIKGKTWVNNHAHVLKFNNMSTQKFVEYYLNSIKLDDYISGMAQPKLNQKMLNSIPIPYPEITIQHKIVDILDNLKDGINQVEQIYQKELSSLEELKKSILHNAFNGKLK